MTDFYEDDEPTANVVAAFDRGPKHRTGQAEEAWGFEIDIASAQAGLHLSGNRLIERTGIDVPS